MSAWLTIQQYEEIGMNDLWLLAQNDDSFLQPGHSRGEIHGRNEMLYLVE